MKVSKDNFFSVASDLQMPKEKAEALWSGLEKLDQTSAEATPLAKYLYFFGAMIVISAMTWFMNLAWELFGGGGIFLISCAYAFVFTLIGSLIWNKKDLKIPSGLLITMAVCMVPLAVYGLETYFNLWPIDEMGTYQDFYQWIDKKWIVMEVSTILAAIVALFFFPFPFLTAPLFFAAWFLTMDIIPLIFGKNISWKEANWTTLCFGLALITIGFIIDRRKKADYSFWSYLFGVLTFWGALGCLTWGEGEKVFFIYFLINLVMMLFSILVRRNVFMVFGAIGTFCYLGHLAYNVFQDWILFPFALSVIGLGIIYLGILYQRNLSQIEKSLFDMLPAGIKTIFLNHREQ